MVQTAPYGSWTSPISSERLARGGIRLGSSPMSVRDGALYWLEERPREAGRGVIVRRRPSGEIADITPPGWSVRSLAHEYGGGAYAVGGERVWFASFQDQRLYLQAPGASPVPISTEPEIERGVRWADFDCAGQRVYCVRETHFRDREPANELVAIAADSREVHVLDEGHDFVAYPRLSPEGTQLAWTAWDHPRMPWDGTELWVADVGKEAGGIQGRRRVAGGERESIFQPGWAPDGRLCFVSDRTGWWNLYRLDGDRVEPLAPREAEFGRPQWGFGMRTYAFLADGRIACTWTQGGLDHLGVLDPGTGELQQIESRFTSFGAAGPVALEAGRVAVLAASPREPACIAIVEVDTAAVEVVRRSSEDALDPGFVSEPEPIEFPSEGGGRAYAFFYAPRNPGFRGSEAERPPLVVLSHGGPTSSTSSAFNPTIQFWTTRGLAVVDVNYGGSTGYGRKYRERLCGQWGVVDTRDCVGAARWLAGQGRVDPERMAIRGGSAGGYTTLCALVFHETFRAGVSYYGIADLEILARDTHKFESRYLDSLIGPYPQTRELYRQRSPIHFADRLSCPILLLQGLEDAVVPPSQAEVMTDALRRKGLPFAYLPFEGEQHGFRKAENIARAHEAELAFYGKVFGFEPADSLPPLPPTL